MVQHSKLVGVLKSPTVTKEIMSAVLAACDRALVSLVESQPSYQAAELRDRHRMRPILTAWCGRLDSFYFVFYLEGGAGGSSERSLGVFFPESHTDSEVSLLFSYRHRDAIAGALKPELAELDVWRSLAYQEDEAQEKYQWLIEENGQS